MDIPFYIFLILVLNWRLITDKWRTSCLGIWGSQERKRVLGDAVVSWLNLLIKIFRSIYNVISLYILRMIQKRFKYIYVC